MRITNKIMERNSMSNINKNKEIQDKLSTQMATQKKISKASEDPVVAIRALRLRSNVTEISQYYEKNIPDAESWMDVTEDALKNLSSVLTNMIEQCTKGSNGDLTTSDRQIILEQLKALSDEVYATGDADYAGRYVFTGFRTDTSLSFTNDTDQLYSITEQIDKSVLDSVDYVNTGNLLSWTESNYSTLGNTAENDVSSATVHRIRLSYDVCKSGVMPDIQYYAGKTDTDGNPIMSDLTDGTGYTMTMCASSNTIGGLDPYTYVDGDKDAMVFVPDTGEILLGENVYNTLMATKDDTSTTIDESQIWVTYSKEKWKGTDLRPEHFFYCETTDPEGNPLSYNDGYLKGEEDKQAITYDVGFNQTIQVNSRADECFKLGIRREIDDLTRAMSNVIRLDTLHTQLKKKIEDTPASDTAALTKLKSQMAAVEKSLTYVKDDCQRSFEAGITAMQGFLDDTNLALTDEGTRSSKLELIKNRTQNQKTTFETLRSTNEDIDVTEVAIELTSAATTYDAALMSTGKIMQHTLLDYV